MYKIDPNTKIRAVRYYLKNGATLKQTALLFKIHYLTLFKYITLYRKYGEARLIMSYHRPWNRTDKELEEKIVYLKENNPGLTVKNAQEILKKAGIKISTKGIWGVWKRYGYTGFDKTKLSVKFTEYFPWTEEAKAKFKAAQEVFSRGDIKLSAEILNSTPMLPNNELLQHIPDALLSRQRRIEKISILYWEMPASSYLKEVRQMQEKFRKKGLYYSMLRLTLLEAFVLSWLGESKKQLNLTLGLKEFIQKKDNRIPPSLFAFRFLMSISEGVAYMRFLHTEETYKRIRLCHRQLMSRNFLIPYFMEALGILYTHVDDFNKAEFWYSKVLDEYEKKDMDSTETKNFLSSIYYLKGDYKKALSLLENADTKGWHYNAKYLLIQATRALVNGMPHKAMSFSSQAIMAQKKEGIRWGIYSANMITASAYCSLGEKVKAISILRRTLGFVKQKYKRGEFTLRLLISHICNTDMPQGTGEHVLPRVKLVLLLKRRKYHQALKYARRKGIIAILQSRIIFFPALIAKLLERGKPTGVPRAMLHLPALNNRIPVYNIRFMGHSVFYKNRKYIKGDLSPKLSSFVIYCALNMSEPGEKIQLADIYQNFWKNSKYPGRNLSHLLVKVRKILKIPSHLPEISHRSGEPVLINQGIHFISDYSEFEQALATAHAFERADEWEFAKKEYLYAFKLFRGAPFEKMYDPWSEQMRRVILNKLETETLHFAKSCFEQGNRRDAKRVLQKVHGILPESEEIKNMVNQLR